MFGTKDTKGNTQSDVLPTSDELDLSGDSAVEVVTSTWTVQSAETEDTDGDNGAGKRVVIEAESDEWHSPITLRFFISYESKTGKSTDWVKRSRGQLKNLIKAISGTTNLAEALNVDDREHYIVGKTFTATTRDGGDGFATLSRFKKVA